MPRSINLYMATRTGNVDVFNMHEKHLSLKEDKSNVQEHEINSLRCFVFDAICNGLSIADLDGFFYSYKIPQIGKEFDLLKLTGEYCLNIELKSQTVPEEKIWQQLKKNKHYLSHLGKKVFLYTYISSTKQCYFLDDNNVLFSCSLFDVFNSIRAFSSSYLDDIDELFRPSDFLVSPLNTPEKFLNGEYFLTQQQEEIKRKVMDIAIAENRTHYVSIIGRPGTGKTLLVYDLAKSLSAYGQALIIHCGKLSQGQLTINEQLDSVSIISAGRLKYGYDLSGYRFVLLDETHRIFEAQFDTIISSTMQNHQFCILSSDANQVLSQAEERRNISRKIANLNPISKFELSDKIRTNKELAAFIRSILNLNNKKMDQYKNAQLLYADNVNDAKAIIEYLKYKGFTFINFSQSNYNYSPYSQYEAAYDTHHVIGQEFDNVLMVLDNSFYYDSNLKLAAVMHPNPDYLYRQLFYQGITRVREKVALLIVGNPQLFEQMLSVFDVSND